MEGIRPAPHRCSSLGLLSLLCRYRYERAKIVWLTGDIYGIITSCYLLGFNWNHLQGLQSKPCQTKQHIQNIIQQHNWDNLKWILVLYGNQSIKNHWKKFALPTNLKWNPNTNQINTQKPQKHNYKWQPKILRGWLTAKYPKLFPKLFKIQPTRKKPQF